MGVDLHGRDYTKAAKRAVKDALRHNSLGFARVVGQSVDAMHVDVTIGVPQPDAVDREAVAGVLPHGHAEVRVVQGGLEIPSRDGRGRDGDGQRRGDCEPGHVGRRAVEPPTGRPGQGGDALRGQAPAGGTAVLVDTLDLSVLGMARTPGWPMHQFRATCAGVLPMSRAICSRTVPRAGAAAGAGTRVGPPPGAVGDDRDPVLLAVGQQAGFYVPVQQIVEHLMATMGCLVMASRASCSWGREKLLTPMKRIDPRFTRSSRAPMVSPTGTPESGQWTW